MQYTKSYSKYYSGIIIGKILQMIWIWISYYDPDYKPTMRLSIIHYTNKTEKSQTRFLPHLPMPTTAICFILLVYLLHIV